MNVPLLSFLVLSSTAFAGSAWGQADQPRGPVLLLDFEHRGSPLRDGSGRGHDGVGTPGTLIPGPWGQARLFRTVADRIKLPEHQDFALDGPLSIAVTLRVDSLGLHQHVAACDDKWAFWITPDNRFRVADTRGGGLSTEPASVIAGRWTTVVAVVRGTAADPITPETVALYVDGQLASASTHLRTDAARAAGRWSPGPLYPTDACYVGFESHQGNAQHQTMPFVGAIEELRVYPRALSEAEIVALSRRP